MNNKQLIAICRGYERDNNLVCAEVLEQMYIDYFNDYLTTAQMAEHSDLELNTLEHALELGRTYNHETRNKL